MKNAYALFLLLVLVTGNAEYGFAQQGTTSLRGTVTDPDGAVIAGATVVLENTDRGIRLSTSTSENGAYEFLQVSPASYSLTVSMAGFKTVVESPLVLQVAVPATVNVKLSISAVAETVTVDASEVPGVNTTDATLGNAFHSKQVLALPSEGRNPVELLSLQPGVTYVGNQVDTSSDSRGGAVNGARSDQSNVTVDGLDNNDQTLGHAFTGVLRIPADSIEEFRVTTSNSTADSGRSSGAQVALITKSGTNQFHGAAYEYNRSSIGQANDWFNKWTQLTNGQPNKPGHLVRNTFGGALGGPIRKNRLFFFANYEGQRSRETQQVLQTVPSDNLRNGIVQYPCDASVVNGTPVDPNCTLSNTAVQVTAPPAGQFPGQLLVTLKPSDIARMDQGCSSPTPPLVVTCPLGSGVNPAVLALWNGNATLPNGQTIPAYPHANTTAGTNADGLNLLGYSFAASAPQSLNTYLTRLDYNLTENGNHRLFLRGDLQGDRKQSPPQFPGQPPSQVTQDNSRGLFVGYAATLSNTLINNFRYGFVRQGIGETGPNQYSYASMWNFSDQVAFGRTSNFNVPVHQFTDDVTLVRGRHTLQFGGNWRLVNNNRYSNAQNFFSASPHPTFFGSGGAIAGTNQDLDPGSLSSSGYPYVAGTGPNASSSSVTSFGGSYDAAIAPLAGVFGSITAAYLQDKNGRISSGTIVPRHYRANEMEFYAQDAWHPTAHLTVTYGLRYSLLQPPYETSGNQVAAIPGLGDFFNQRAAAMNQGETVAPTLQFDLSGPANGKQPYWNWDYRDLAPRLALAYSPNPSGGLLRSLFGSNGKSSIRAGYGMYYDHFGQGVVNSFDRMGSFGLTTSLQNPSGVTTTNCAARFVSITTIPGTLACPITPGGAPVPELPQAPTVGFPFTPPGAGQNGSFAIGWGLDEGMKTPYAHVFDLAVTRELPGKLVLEVAYTGRLGHRLLQEVDMAQPLNIRDPQSGMTYYEASAALAKLVRSGTAESAVQPIPFWENMFPAAAGSGHVSGYAPGIPGNPTATQNIYDLFYQYQTSQNWIYALQSLDTNCIPACSRLGQFAFFDPQFSSLYAWRSIGHSYYHALEISLNHHTSSLQFGFNYTYSKSIDMNSNAERINEYEGGGTAVSYSGQTINAWSPFQLRAPSDYDLTHQINANFVWDLPFGKGRRWSSDGKVAEALLGNWQLSGLGRWTSGFPVSIETYAFATNYEQDARGNLVRDPGKIGVYTDSNGLPNLFQRGGAAADAFDYPFAGDSGQRNNLRGPGYFGIDASLAKSWKFGESHSLRFQWDTYNVTNAVRFDVGTINNYLLYPSTLGEFKQTLTKPRVMQFGLRYDF